MNPNDPNQPQPLPQTPPATPTTPVPTIDQPTDVPTTPPPVPQVPPQPVEPQPQAPAPAPAQPMSPVVVNRGGKGKFLILLLILLILIAGGAVGYTVLSNRTSQQEISQATPIPTPIQPKDDELAGFTKGIAIGPNTISVTKADGKFCLRYKGKIYLPQDLESEIPKVVEPPDPSLYTWYGLLNAPDDLTDQDSELFSFKSAPDNQSFSFIMRWARSPQEQFEMYRFTMDGVSPIKSFGLAAFEGAYWVPRISSLSENGQYAAVHTYKCIDCAVHFPETLLFNLPQVQSKSIGKVQSLEWAENGAYTYKEAQPTACSDAALSECYQDPTTLPALEGNFSS